MVVNYNRIVKSRCAIKYPNQSGLSLKIDDNRDVVSIQAINPKTNNITTHFEMQIPMENVKDVIKALQMLLEES